MSSQSGFPTSPDIKLSGTCREGCGEVHVFHLCVWLWTFSSSIAKARHLLSACLAMVPSGPMKLDDISQ